MYAKSAIPGTTISRIIRQHCKDLGYKIRIEAVDIVHEALENFMVELFAASNLICIHAERHTLRSKDLQIAAEVATILKLDKGRCDIRPAFSKREDPGEASPTLPEPSLPASQLFCLARPEASPTEPHAPAP